jgi:probable F420-dependent oxidoreductase
VNDFRFGFTVGSPRSVAELAETCRTAEAFGYDVATVVDHLGPGRLAPFQALVAVAGVSERLRVGSYVINNAFWNPAMLAREVVTAIRLTEGRLELGLGIGLIKAEFDAAGIPFRGFNARRAALLAAIDEIDSLITAEGDLARPPLLIGGTGERVLRLAAERADIVSFAGLHQRPDMPPGSFRLSTPEQTRQQVDFVRSAAGARGGQLELNNFVKVVEITDDRAAVAKRLAAEEDDYLVFGDAEDALHSPFLLIGTEDEIARQLVEDRRTYGFSAITVMRPHMEVLGPIIGRVRGLAGTPLAGAAPSTAG